LWELELIVHGIVISILLTFCKAGATIILGTTAALLVPQMLTCTGRKQSWAILALSYRMIPSDGRLTNVFSILTAAFKL
jgi:hypothetical protein